MEWHETVFVAQLTKEIVVEKLDLVVGEAEQFNETFGKVYDFLSKKLIDQ